MKTAERSSRAIVWTALLLAGGAWAWAQSQSSPAPSGSGSATQTQSDDKGKSQTGAEPVKGDVAAPAKTESKDKKDEKGKTAPGTEPVKGDAAPAAVNPDKVVEVGSEPVKVKPGSIEDVNAVGTATSADAAWATGTRPTPRSRWAGPMPTRSRRVRA